MKLVSWNVNGLRACLGKGFGDSVASLAPDILCLQETKMERGQADPGMTGYHEYWSSAEKKGYSGTAVFSRTAPLAAREGIGIPEHDREGRTITLEFPDFYLVNVYTPNSQRGLARLPYRMEWEDHFRDYLAGLDRDKPVIACGDMNVAHQEIDIKNAKSNRKNAGFTDEEREKMSSLLAAGFVDTFRERHPGRRDAYTWWSYMAGARERNIGWRIDYFLISRRLWDRVDEAEIYPHIPGSDHCPIGLGLAQ